MDDTGEDLSNYWDGEIFLRAEELDGSGLDEALSSYSGSSVFTERNRRKKLNERLFALRAVVPNITKMEKTSIIKDAIDYIQELKERERILRSEIEKLESSDVEKDPPIVLRSKKRKAKQLYDPGGAETAPIEVLDLRVTFMGEKTMAVSLTCRKRRATMVKLCEVFETIKLKLITSTINEHSGTLTKTLFIEAEEDEKDVIKVQIEMAIQAINAQSTPYEHLKQTPQILSPSTLS